MLREIAADPRHLSRILDNLMEGIIAHDSERRIFFFNRAAESITGYSRSEVIGKDCHEIFGAPFCGKRCSFCDGPPVSLNHASYSINIATKSGEQRQVEMSVTGMCDEQGHFEGVLAAFRDLTDLIGLKIRLGELTSFAGIIGKHPRMLEIFQQITHLAGSDYPVHISGETGTGKELVAAAIHNESRRGGGPFVPVNCGAIPEGLIESEFFGHVKGAFSGALRDRKGRFELAHGGTIFLDEISELSRSMQVKLLRVLQDGTFERVGDERTIKVDARVISATNRDIREEMEKGLFRHDLYYRLNVVPLHLPALRERKSDIPLLATHFLENSAHDHPASSLSEDALSALMEHSWPGNIRELQNALSFALVQSMGGLITRDALPLELRAHIRGPAEPGKKLNAQMVSSALQRTGGNKLAAARLLGVGRATLYRYLGSKTVS